MRGRRWKGSQWLQSDWKDDAKRIKASLEADVCYEQHSRASTSHKWRAAKMLETPQNYHRDMNASGDISL